MSTVVTLPQPNMADIDWTALARDLGQRFADRAAEADARDQFVAQNFADLKASPLLCAGVPKELGGGGASHQDMSDMLRMLARHCGSTALAFAMHSHQVAVAAWRWRHQKAPTDALLQKVAAQRLVLISSGGSDWLAGSGVATRTDGGFLINARKVFSSGVPAGDLLLTSAVCDDPESGATVLHFAVPLNAQNVRVLDTWHTLGMRGTGSHDVLIEDFFVADAAISGRRPQGKWHPLFHIISMIAFPLIYAVYVGIAEAARDMALEMAGRRIADPNLPYLVGEMERHLLTAQLAHRHMMEAAGGNAPGVPTTNAVMAGRVLAGEAAINAVGKAMEVAGGAGFYRTQPLERLFRDVQAARYHPLQDKQQLRFSGRAALGLDVDE